MSLLYCSLTGTASNWYDRLPQVYKDDWSSFLRNFKKQFYSQKHAYHAQIEALSLVKKDNENVRQYALKVENFDKQGWYNEYPSTINLKFNGIFTHGLPKKLKDFTNKRQVKHISSSLEPSIPFHSLVNMVDSEDITLEKIKLKNFLLKLIIFRTPSNKIYLFKILLRNLHKSKQCILIINQNLNLKNIVLFATKITTLFQLAFVDSICLKNLNHNLGLQLLPFINILKPPLINLNMLATVVEVIVILTVDLLVTLDIDLVLTRARILVLDTMINLTLITILLITTVIDLDMTNIITKTPQILLFFTSIL